MDPAGSGNDLIFPAQVALYGEPRDPREGSGPSPDPRPTSSLRPGPNANGPGHAFASPPSRRAIRRFPTGIRLLPTSYTGPKGNLSRAGHIRSIVHASAQAPDLSHARESIRGSGKRGDRRPFLHSGGIFPSRHEKAPAPTFPTRAGHPSHHPQDNRARNLSHAGDTGGSGSRHPPPLSYAHVGILHNVLIVLEEYSLSCARVGIYRDTLRERSGHPLSYARGGGILRPFRIQRRCAHFPTHAGHQGKAEGVRFFADLSYARGYCYLFPPRLSPHEGRAPNREARQHHAGPFRAGPFRLRGKVRVPLPFGSGLPVCRVLPPPRSGTDGFCPPPGGSSASARFPHSRSFHRYSAAFTRRHTVPDRPHSGRGAGSDRH